MRLYIAEKPSMGRELAKCLAGPLARHDGYLSTGEGIVTWLFGHVLRQAEPEEYDEKYKRWRFEDLPIIPGQWRLFVAKDCEKQFAIVKGLIDQCDEIVHAGDPDREGQLLVDEVLDYLGNQKPVKRILLNALDEKSIRKANQSLRENGEFFNLKQSALARARADWLIGMNLSRAYTLAARRAGHERIVLPIGRVKTPTLALVVRREREIENFRPVNYYTIKAEFVHEKGSFTAQWKPGEEQPGLDSEGRLIDRSIAEEKRRFFVEEPHEGRIVSCKTAKKQEPPPLPFSLSSLQVLAGKRYGYEPQLVLDTAQALYEKKLATYPRSDCEYLPENQLPDAAAILKMLGGTGDAELAAWAGKADPKRKSRAWNDKKITAHHAIIPTAAQAKLEGMTQAERDIYHLIARNYIAQFYPLHVYDQTKVEVDYKKERFAAGGRIVRQQGWKELYAAPQRKQKDDDSEEKDGEEAETTLPPMKAKEPVTYREGTLAERMTKPPVRFTPSTLLAGMKEIHKYVKNPEAKKQLKDVYGIGTEATRATIIEDLIKRGFLKAQGKKKQLTPTPAAYLLVDALPDEMTYPDSTAIWEDRLHSMSDGDGTLEDFLESQISFTKTLCEKALSAPMEVRGKYPCPRCHQGVLVKRHGRNGDFWGCTNYPRCRMSCDDREGAPALPPGNASLGKSRPTEAGARADSARGAKPVSPAGTREAVPTASKAGNPQYLCPSCKEGSLRRIQGRNGAFWGCTNYPRCTATFDDAKGKPVLQS